MKTLILSLLLLLSHAYGMSKNIKGKIRATSSGFDRLSFTKQYMAVKLGVTYNFNSGKGFRTPRIEKNNDGTRLQKVT